ncbi:MAG: hypothetical protein QNJ73_04785, partial [Gammaproteobacteria bacterium]|nr:hypothetical protein [Gammaproteobacteria bacterium]
ILLAENVEADVSFNLYDVTLDEAIRSIAAAAGFFVERRNQTYFVMPEQQAGKMPGSSFTVVKSMPIQYADPAQLETKLGDYLSDFGNITALPERKLLVVEDQPGFVYRINRLVNELDKRPPQVLIEAKILEIALSDELSFGIDWNGMFTNGNGEGDLGIQGLLTPGNSGNAGFFFNYLDSDIEVALRALESDGRVRNLASPRVVTVVNEEAEVIIGDRRGYRVTTTINQVTTESIEFLESGTILRVTPTIDESGQILLNIHPEVSTGTVDENGIPSQTTTEVTTRLLVSSGESIFIGGLMRNTTTETRAGIPVLGNIPGLRWAFSSRSRTTFNTETVVIITPRLLDPEVVALNKESQRLFNENESEMLDRAAEIEATIEDNFWPPQPPEQQKTGAQQPVIEGQYRTDAQPQVEPVDEPVVKPVVDAEPVADTEVEPEADQIEPVTIVPEPAAEPAPAEAAPAEPAVEPTIATATAEESVADEPVVDEPAEPAIAEESVIDEPMADQPGETQPVTEQAAAAIEEKTPTGRYAINLHSELEPIETPPTDVPSDQLLYITETDIDGETWYRLRLGFFDTEADAQAVLDDWIDEFPRAWLVKVGPRERADASADADPPVVASQSIM